jgi:hypothetical protein
MASTGQISTHSPQPVQLASTCRPRVPPGGPGRMACAGQVSRQAPQPWQAPMRARSSAVTVPTGIRAG